MKLYLRRAVFKDCNLLFIWTNDKIVRNNSFNQNEILYEEHVKWLKSKLYSNRTVIFILLNDGVEVGQIRIDIEKNNGIIDYSIDKKYRGKGYGNRILHELEKEIIKGNNICISALVGKVKYDNTNSQRAFEKNNYKKIMGKDYIFYSKEIKIYG